MYICTRVVLPLGTVEALAAKSLLALLQNRGIDTDQAFWAETTAAGIVVEQSRQVKPAAT